MSKTSKKSLKTQLSGQIEKIEELVQKLDKLSTQISYIRLGYFAVSVFALYLISRSGSDLIFFTSLLALILGFLYLISRHRRVTGHRDELSFLMKIKQQHLARIDLKWNELPAYKYQKAHPDHPFNEDLNITGAFSVHHLMDTSIYEGGSNRLADWLLAYKRDRETILKRQELVKELIPLTLFRDRLQVNAYMSRKSASENDWTMEQLLKWMRNSRKVKFKSTLSILSVLAVSNIILLILAIAGVIGPYVLITFMAYLGVYNFNSHKVSGLYDAAYQTDKLLHRFGDILIGVEEYKFKDGSRLKEFFSDLKKPGQSPSVYLKKVSKLASAAALRKNQVLWPLVNMAIPWDMYFSMKMENLKADLAPKLSNWLDVFYDLEALNSLANFGALNPEYHFPEFYEEEGDAILVARDLGHPLIPHEQKVTNHFTVEKGDKIFLITGSNMAGKSTFLRTVGVNLVLAFAGAPVNASSMETRLFRLFSSISIKDSLGDGLSHFYAEVKRLRTLLDELEAEEEHPLFYFVDEIFKGTNNRERFEGSTKFLKYVAQREGVGMVSTHDLELATLEEEIDSLSNWHFAETIEDGKMSFHYNLKEGPCPTTNALKIMQMEGLPV